MITIDINNLINRYSMDKDDLKTKKTKSIMKTRIEYVTNDGKETFTIEEKETKYEIYSNVFGDEPATTYDKKDWTYDEVVEDYKEHENNILEVMFEGDKTAESKQFESNLIEFFKMRRLQGDKIQIIKANYDDRTQLSGVYGVDECIKIENQWFSLDSFIAHVAEMIGFEIAERIQSSEYATVVNESGFKISATLVEA